jgi:hypothetical protein
LYKQLIPLPQLANLIILIRKITRKKERERQRKERDRERQREEERERDER